MDWSLTSNRLIGSMSLGALAVAAVVYWNGGAASVLLAPLHTFVAWALVREIDPDHDGAALLAGLASAAWVLWGLDSSGLAFGAGLVVAGRVVLGSTGRRPLPTDLIGVVIIAAAVSFSPTGWVAGFAIAVAVYIDDRTADVTRPVGVLAAVMAALSASAVASLASVLPDRFPDARPELVIPVGLAALASLMREPVTPKSVVDSRRGTVLSRDRLHSARALAAVAIFTATVVAGEEAGGIVPFALALVVALVSGELARRRRRI